MVLASVVLLLVSLVEFTMYYLNVEPPFMAAKSIFSRYPVSDSII